MTPSPGSAAEALKLSPWPAEVACGFRGQGVPSAGSCSEGDPSVRALPSREDTIGTWPPRWLAACREERGGPRGLSFASQTEPGR